MLHTAPSGQPYIGVPPTALSSASDPNRAARVPLDKVRTGEGVTQSSKDNRSLWLECQSAGFKVESEIKPEGGQQASEKEVLLRDSSKNVQSVVVEVDQSAESPSALVVLTLAPSAGSSSPRYYHFHLALSHSSYSHLDVEKLKHILRGWQQASNGTLKAVIAPQLALSPSDPRPPSKPENYNPSDSTTWVAPFPIQVPPAPSAPAAATSSGLTSIADLDADADGDDDAPGEADLEVNGRAGPSQSPASKKRRASHSPSQPFKAGSPEAFEDALLLQNAAGGDPLFWNDTGRARRRSTLKVRSYAPDALDGNGAGEAPMEMDGNGGERAHTPKSPSKNASYPYPSAAPAHSSNKRTLDADATAAKKRRRSPSHSLASPGTSAANLPSVGGHFTRGASAAAQQQQQQQQQQIEFALAGNLPPLPEGLAAHVAAARPSGASRVGPSTPSSSAFPLGGAGPSSAHAIPTTPAHSYTPGVLPGSAPAGAAGGAGPTPLSVYSQLHDLYAYVAQLAPMVTESKGTIQRLELEGVEREREVRRLREEVMLLRSTGSPRGSQASLGDVGEATAMAAETQVPAQGGNETAKEEEVEEDKVHEPQEVVEEEKKGEDVSVQASEADAAIPTSEPDAVVPAVGL
ncbi:hypothetical protein JCM11251_004652 [Rhodosporidiobolus azoricus]